MKIFIRRCFSKKIKIAVCVTIIYAEIAPALPTDKTPVPASIADTLTLTERIVDPAGNAVPILVVPVAPNGTVAVTVFTPPVAPAATD